MTVNELTILSNCSQGCANRAVTNRCLLLCTRHLPTSAQQSSSKFLTFMPLLVLTNETRYTCLASPSRVYAVYAGLPRWLSRLMQPYRQLWTDPDGVQSEQHPTRGSRRTHTMAPIPNSYHPADAPVSSTGPFQRLISSF